LSSELDYKDLLSSKFKMKKDEIDVYLSLLTFGAMNIAEISMTTKLPESNVKIALETLMEKNCVLGRTLDNGDTVYYAMPLYAQMPERISELQAKLQVLKKSIMESATKNTGIIEKELSKISDDVLLTFSKSIEENIVSLKSVKGDFSRRLDELKKVLESNRTRLANIERLFEENESLLNQMREEINQMLSEADKDFIKSVKRLSAKLQTSLDSEFKKELKTGVSLFSNNLNLISEELNQFATAYKEKMSNVVTLIETTIDDTNEALSRALSDTKAAIDTGASAISKETKRLVDEYTAKISDRKAQLNRLSQQYLTSLNKKTEQFLEDYKASTLKLTTSLSEETTDLLQKVSDDTHMILKNNEEKLIEQVNSIESTLTSDLEKIKKLLIDSVHKQESLFNEITTNLTDASEKLLLGIIDSVKKDIPITISELYTLSDKFETKNESFLKDTSNRIIDQLDKYYSAILEKKSQISKSLHETTQSLLNQINDDFNVTKRDLDNHLETLLNLFASSFTELREYTKNQINQYLDRIQETNKTLYENIISLFSEEIQSQITIVNELATKLDTTFKELLSTISAFHKRSRYALSQIMTKQIQDMNASYKVWSDGISSMVQDFVTQFTTFMSTMQNTMTSYVEDQVKTIADSINNAMNETINALDVTISEKTKELRKHHKKLVSSINNFVEIYNSFQTKTENLLDEAITKHNDEANQLIDTINQNILSHISEGEKSITNSYTQHIHQLTKLLDSKEEAIENALYSMVEQADKALDTDIGTLNAALNEIKQRIIDEIATITKENLDMLGEFKQYFEKVLNNLLKAIEDSAMDKKQEFSNAITGYSKSVTDIVKENIGEITIGIENTTASTDALTNELKDRIRGTIHVLSSTIGDKINLVISKWSELPEGYINNYTAETEKFIESLEPLRESIIKEFQTVLSEIEVSINEHFNELQKEILGTFETQSKQVLDIISSTFRDISEVLDRQISSSSAHISETEKVIDGLVDKVKEGISLTAESYEKEISEALNELRSEISSQISTFNNNALKLIKTLMSTVLKKVEEQIDTAIEASNQNKTITKESLEMLLNEISESSADLLTHLTDELSQITESISGVLDKFSDDLNKKFDALKNNIEKNMKRLSKEADKSVSRVLKSHDDLVGQMDAAWTVFKRSLDEKPYQVWAIFGIDAVRAHIKKLLSDSKNTVVLTLPEIDEDLKTSVLNVADECLVELILPSNTPHIITDALKKRPNIRIWLTKKKITFYSAVRDDKESFIAIIPENKQKEIMGIISLLKENIEFLKNIVFPQLVFRVKPL